MLYYLFNYLQDTINLPGASLFGYLSFRASLSVILALLISLVFGKKIIHLLRKKQIGETVRNLGLNGQKEKEGTPTMGGIIIIASILIPTLLFADLSNIYILLLIVCTFWMGSIGFLDDYIKVFKKNKEGLRGKFKILGQVGLGLIVGLTLILHKEVRVRDFSKVYVYKTPIHQIENRADIRQIFSQKPIKRYAADTLIKNGGQFFNGYYYTHDTRSLRTNIPFLKGNGFDYVSLTRHLGNYAEKWAWLIYVCFVIFLITAVSNGANITDGIDGLAAGTSAIIGTALGILAYVSGNIVFSQYLGVLYIPGVGELVVFIAAFMAACIGFLWYNVYPAQVFMGDTGSLALGGIIAALAIITRKEMLIPIICGIFLIENLSVILQVGYFKYTKKRYGQGIRIFKMAPLHHHYQKNDLHESKIVARFWIVGVALMVISILMLKIR